MLEIVKMSFSETGEAVGWLRAWLLVNLMLQLIQLPFRVSLQRRLTLISSAPVEDIPDKLTVLVSSAWWRVVKLSGYAVYATFAVGVILSWWFSVRGGFGTHLLLL